MPQLSNPDSGAVPLGIMTPLGFTTRTLRSTVALLMATLVVAMYAGLAALILPIVVLRSVFGGGGRRQRRVGTMEPLLRGRSVPIPATPRARSLPFPATTLHQP